MGLAASQARLLTITARLADNELRSQTINNAKMRLATQSAQASDEYVSALNNAQMMFTNTSADGLSQKQALTFNALTQYSQYNNQYGIVNSAGQIMVSEEDAEIFKSHKNNLEGFLKAHNLEWETTFFDDKTLQDKLSSFYTGDNAYIANLLKQKYKGKTGSEALKNRYLDSLSQDASIEMLNYQIYSQNYYQQLVVLYDSAAPEFRAQIMGDATNKLTAGSPGEGFSDEVTSDNISEWFKKTYGSDDNATTIRDALLTGNPNPAGAPTSDGAPPTADSKAAYALNNVEKYLTEYGITKIKNFIASLRDDVYPGAGTKTAGFYNEEFNYSGPAEGSLPHYYNKYVSKSTNPDNGVITYTYPDRTTGSTAYKDMGEYNSIKPSKTYTCDGITIVIDEAYPTSYADDPANTMPKTYETKSYIEVNSDDWYYNDTHYPTETSNQQALTNVPTDEEALKKFIMDEIAKIKYKKTDSDNFDGKDPAGSSETYYQAFQVSIDKNGNKNYENMLGIAIRDEDRGRVYKEFVQNYLYMILNNGGYFDQYEFADNNSGLSNLSEFANARQKFEAEYGFSPKYPDSLIDMDKMISKGDYENTDGFSSVLNSWLVDKMLDVLGEPKYAWVDKSDPTNVGNADAKAQWLTNLFNRMQKGYKVLENGLAKSPEWLQYAFESGLVRMEQVDLSYNWVSMDYKSCSNIFEETDNSTAVSKAEAKYNRAMNDIKQKDSMFDLQLKNIDTEHSSLQTEYDVVKGVMNKNIERTMKFNQSA